MFLLVPSTVVPERILKWGHMSGAKFFFVPLHFFCSTCTISRSPVSRFGECFRDSVQFGQFLVCWSSTHDAPYLAICNSEGARASVPNGSRRHWLSKGSSGLLGRCSRQCNGQRWFSSVWRLVQNFYVCNAEKTLRCVFVENISTNARCANERSCSTRVNV